MYSATKFGLRGFALSLREDLRSAGVGVSVVLPGFIRDAGMFADTGVKLPLGVGTKAPEDVADAVLRASSTNRAEVDVAPAGLAVRRQLRRARTRDRGAVQPPARERQDRDGDGREPARQAPVARPGTRLPPDAGHALPCHRHPNTPHVVSTATPEPSTGLPPISKTVLKACIWCGPIMGLLFVTGFLIAGFFPPPAPGRTAHQISAYIAQNRTAIRVGIVICLASCALLMPFQAAFTVHMKRIEGVRPILAYTQLALAALATLEFVIPYIFMLVSTYRPGTNPDVTQALFDLSWFFFLGVVCTFVPQLAIFGIAVLLDKRPTPIFPRWLGYLNLWLCLTFTPASLIVFFKHGAFAWNGLFVWWVPVTAFLFWFVPNFVYLLKATEADDGQPTERDDDLRREVRDLRARLERLESR